MDRLISTQQLADALGKAETLVLDASLHLPGAGRDAGGEFAAAHIPGAHFLDLASLHDPASSLPGKVPDSSRVAERLSTLGAGPDTHIVLYDDSDLRSACRAWYLLTVHGVDNVSVLDGGLGKWRAEGRPVEKGDAVAPIAAPQTLGADRAFIRSKAEMLDNVSTHQEQVVDARDAGRFTGETVDTVHNLPGGHIPGAKNLPFTQLFAPDGTFLPRPRLAEAFREAGIDLQRPVVTSCGSGVTASVLTFALTLLGAPTHALYDGSWSEWGSDPATPKEQGPAQ
ncbi:sulfurtransferase [Qipengyuania sp. DSG2-2]|uniref:sulfurtransferase n=1 Tax=Qipengyuania sp. DGS2-2 TaxID=3349631 RepID=UPI0036D2C02D